MDHIHVYVPDRAEAEKWYARVLGFVRVAEFEDWAPDGGPLMVARGDAPPKLALFEKPADANRSIIALGTDAQGFLAWKNHLSEALGEPIQPVDHGKAWSMYFKDPWGNPFEVTTYEYEGVADAGP